MYYHAVLNHEFKLEWSNIDKWPIKSDINNTYTCIRRIRQKQSRQMTKETRQNNEQ